MGLLDNRITGQPNVNYYADANMHGTYQYTDLDTIVNNFMLIYTGEDKVVKNISRIDVVFYASQCLAELNFDTLRSNRSLEIELPPSLLMVLPQDYVNYTGVYVVNSNGVKLPLYPDHNTSDPTAAVQNNDGDVVHNINGTMSLQNNSDAWDNYQSASLTTNDNNTDDNVITERGNFGQRFGLNPQHAQKNGYFYINNNAGRIHFSSNISGQTVVLDYISDGLGLDGEMLVPKMAEKAMYSSMICAIAMTKIDIPEYQVSRFKKQKFADVRQAKLRLSNIKTGEITQVLRGKSKQIK
jgi:hypothetical protein